MIVNLPLLNTGVTPLSGMSNLRGGQIAGKSRILAANIKSSGNAVQSQVRQALSQALSKGGKVNTTA
ncbi:MAG: hypothetical protein A3K09_07750 [Nitrospinae bacterium RIFCSPLOWO2_12_FULL_47_7]|nr:MAG: hypothetical protein A3K09_07750 [Nitrospinae bacterium RIFCSPLOWO2_12_FULL_47_7]